MSYVPPGGRDWNKDGKYDWYDRVTDYKVYKDVMGDKHSSDSYSPRVSTSKKSSTYTQNTDYKNIGYHFWAITSPSYRGEDGDRKRVEGLKSKLEERIKEYSSLKEVDLISKKKVLKDFRQDLDWRIGIGTLDLPWLYLAKNPSIGYEIAVLLIALVEKYCDLLSEVLEVETGKKEVLKNIYLWSCSVCEVLCRNSEKLLSDDSFYKGLFDELAVVVAGDKERAKQTLTTLFEIDKSYKIVIGTHALCIAQIMKCLDKEIFLKTPVIQKAFINVAIFYDKIWCSFLKRHVEFYVYPSLGHIEIHWNCYQSILDHLPQTTVDTLEETTRTFFLDKLKTTDEVKELREFAVAFYQNIDAERDKKRKAEQEEKEERFKSKSPNVYKKIEKLEKEREKKESVLEREVAVREELEQKIPETEEKMQLLQKKLQSNQKLIDKLSKRIFGKRKAQEKISIMKAERAELQNQYDQAEEELQEQQQLHQRQIRRCLEQQERIEKVCSQIADIKEKNGF